MRKSFYVVIAILFLAHHVFAGAKKKTKSDIIFRGIGTFTTTETVSLEGDKKRSDSQNEFKGKGLMGKMAAKLFLKSGDEGEIINLPEMTMYRMNHKEKEFKVLPIEKIVPPQMSQKHEEGYPEETETKEEKRGKKAK